MGEFQALATFKGKSYSEDNFEKAALKEMGDMEKNEINLDSQFWPRKPKYLNRVHSGYVWNKYNKIHYDHENHPLPKTIEGYQFNVFYPDLVGKSKVPSHSVEILDGDRKKKHVLDGRATL
ncbi:hypothetical protein M9H77_21248 [Catharanthus roseus]|uniref:Uncharacterized protein n=1 Tax=Catharanthus roseus TaxID=4058 RepID=A0ACC0ANU1_CATRO|nr:hypothetical protein M9H77_21248 [Catharanthus roseus]